MKKKTMTVRLEATKKKALDAIASALDRDRSYVVNEAISQYLDLHRWQIEHIEEGLRQAKAGKFASDAEVAAMFKRLTK